MPLRIFWLRRSQSSSHFNDIINNIDHGTSGKGCGARVDFDSMVFQRFNGYRIWWLVKPYQIIFSSVRFKRILYDFFNLGDIDDEIDFPYEANTEVYYSWKASLNDEMWVLAELLGGVNEQKQVYFVIFSKRSGIFYLTVLMEQTSKEKLHRSFVITTSLRLVLTANRHLSP